VGGDDEIHHHTASAGPVKGRLEVTTELSSEGAYTTAIPICFVLTLQLYAVTSMAHHPVTVRQNATLGESIKNVAAYAVAKSADSETVKGAWPYPTSVGLASLYTHSPYARVMQQNDINSRAVTTCSWLAGYGYDSMRGAGGDFHTPDGEFSFFFVHQYVSHILMLA